MTIKEVCEKYNLTPDTFYDEAIKTGVLSWDDPEARGEIKIENKAECA